ncbi:sentrin-specific protease 1 [Lampris incognitus]|uniref:sentrin-specific protease 1 n=1 Tax=Lampris incognitus TaxID=2546036 RepID=UPI0024B4D203|nr:sentrin-specific protease 1 [Lampris incognitus]
MLTKIYQWIETGFANLRNEVPAADHSDTQGAQEGGQRRRKRPAECMEDGDNDDQDVLNKKYCMGNLIDTVKTAAEGVKSHSSHVATWVKNIMSPTLNSLPASSGPVPVKPQPEVSTSAAAAWEMRPVVGRNSASQDETFAAPSTTLEWKTSKSDSFRNERSVMGPKVYRRQVYSSRVHCDMTKINGHSVSLPPSSTPKELPRPRLGRPLNLRPRERSSCSLCDASGVGTNGTYTASTFETFPIKMVQSPTHSTSSIHPRRTNARCTAEESIREEEREVYRQLLTMVSGGQSSFLHKGSSPAVVRSLRDFTSFLSSSCGLMRFSPPAGSRAGESAEVPCRSPSMQGNSIQYSSNLPSPVECSSRADSQMWSPVTDLSPGGAAIFPSAPSPAVLQVNSPQGTQSSADDSDSVIIVKEQKGEKPDSSSVSCFQAELWIKELTTMYDSRARERRRQIEEQEALTAQLLRQRLSAESQLSPDVEVHVRVPLEKEVPLTRTIDEPKPLEEKPEFPELTEEMEDEVSRVFRSGIPHEVLSEGFGLSLKRKDLQTLSQRNWLNDEVINFYMNLLVERSKDPNLHLPSVDTFSTFFFPKLRSSGYSAVRRWTKKMDIFSLDILLVPVHLGMHWCLSVVDFRKKAIMYFDSMGGNDGGACRILLEYLQQESKDKKGKELDTSGWSLCSKRPNEIPQQMNGSDCGMFTCKYAEYITKDKPITFTQKHMAYFRRRMVWEILNRKLL